MNFLSGDWRERRNILNRGIPFDNMHYSIANYSTDSQMNMKSDIKTLEEEILTKIHSIPDPLKKNLADTVITANHNKGKQKTMVPEPKQVYYEPSMPPEKMATPPNGHRSESYQPFHGLTTFITNFFGAISGAVFHRRARSPVSQYYDCFECDSHMTQEMSPDGWQTAKSDDQNKTIAPGLVSTESNDNMNNCKAAAVHCEDKLNTVRSLLKTNTVSTPPKLRCRRPKRVFADPGSIEDRYEDEFVADNFVSLANDEYIEYFPLPNIQKQEFTEVDAAKMKTEIQPAPESTDIVKVLNDVIEKPEVVQTLSDVTNTPEGVQNCSDVKNTPETTDSSKLIVDNLPEVYIQESTPIVIEKEKPESEIEAKKEIISSCEDKMAKLKSLLEKCKKTKTNINSTASAPEPEPVTGKPPKPVKVIPIEKKQDKKFKNPNRLTEKRRKSRMRKNIQDDMVFAHEIDSEDISSVDNSPAKCYTMQRISEKKPAGPKETGKQYFDELKGRFHSNSTTDSDDSFQIVFSDSPKHSRMRQPSDCDSEDSFIVFEESPDSCYTSNDVFGDNLTTDDDEYSDSDSDISDSGCGTGLCKLSHSFSRTISDLTDDSLYEDTKSQVEITGSECASGDDDDGDNDEVDCAVRTFDEIPEVGEGSDSAKSGLLLDDAKKLRRKDQPPKKVTFSEKPPKVHVMRVWAFAARQARAGHWERHALDRERFKRRIADVDMAVSWVLKPQHRSRVMFQRFMPWWNAQKRKEAAEKKQREAEEKVRKEQERIAEEERKIKEEEEDKVKEQQRIEEEERVQRDLAEGKVAEDKEDSKKIPGDNKEESKKPEGSKEEVIQGTVEGKQKDHAKNIKTNTQKEQIKSNTNVKSQKEMIKTAVEVKKKPKNVVDINNFVTPVSSNSKHFFQNVGPKNGKKNASTIQTKYQNKIERDKMKLSQSNTNTKIINANGNLSDVKINNCIAKENLVTDIH